MALTDSLVSYWKLDETSGTRADSHGAYHLADKNTVGYTTGKVGNAASHVAANTEYLYNTSFADLSGLDWTLAFWVKANAQVNASIILGMGNADMVALQPQWFTGGACYIDIMQSDWGKTARVTPNIPFAADTWYWFCLQYAHSTTKKSTFWLNNAGALTSSVALTGVICSTTRFVVNAARTYGSVGSYCFDCVGVWTRLLTDDERTALYGAGTPPEYPWVPATGNSFIIRAPIPSWCH